jgi:hypothetical protein
MMTNRRITVTALLLALLTIAAPPALAKKKDKHNTPPPPPPACAQIAPDTVVANYRTPQDPTGRDPSTATQANPTGVGLLQFAYELAAPSCAGFTYTLIVFDGDGTNGSGPMVELTRDTQTGDGSSTTISRNLVVNGDNDQRVCVTAEHRDTAGVLLDRIPDTGCAGFGADNGGQGFH